MKLVIITQARIGSTRLPGKVLRKVLGKTLLEMHLERLQRVSGAKVCVAVADEDGIEGILEICLRVGVSYYIGSTEDVLDRYYKLAIRENADYIVRVTSDCPLISRKVIDDLIDFSLSGKYDYAANNFIRHYPHGYDCEFMTIGALEMAWKNGKTKEEREHVTPFLRKSPNVVKGSLVNVEDYSDIRITVDYEEDFKLIEAFVNKFGHDFDEDRLVEYFQKCNELKSMNIKHIIK